MKRTATALIVLALGSVVHVVEAQDLYADPSLGEACDTYDADARACGAGEAAAFPTIAGAVDRAGAGDTIWLRGGDFSEVIRIGTVATEDSPLSLRGMPGEAPRVAGVSDRVLLIEEAAHIVVTDFAIADSTGWGRIVDSEHVEVRDMIFEDAMATGTSGGLKVIRSRFVTLRDSRFDRGNDNITLEVSEHVLITNNTFSSGRHSLLSIRCSSNGIVRGNRFQNDIQKAVEIFDCEGVSDAPFLLDATDRNLIENNRFEGTRESTRAHDYNAIQYAGQRGVVRRNLFVDNLGGGLGFQVYPDEALYNYEHRAYFNTFVDNRCFALIGSGDDDDDRYYGNRVENNAFFRNADCDGAPAPMRIGNEAAVIVENNVFVESADAFEALEGEYTPAESGLLHDAAVYVTTIQESGEGTTLSVADARYFFGASPIAGEEGDLVQLEGQTERARVQSVDLVSAELVLDTSLRFEAGQGISLAYEGSAPDIGATERGFTVAPTPDAGPGGDAGPGRDAGPGSDAGPGRDGGPAIDGSVADAGAMPPDGGDSGCTLSPRRHASASWALAALGVLLGARRRRR